MTPKQRVLKLWSEARCVRDPLERDYVITTDGVIARAGGPTPRAAWADADNLIHPARRTSLK